MSEATVRGKVHVIEETKSYGQKGFRKRLVVLEQENDRFTNYIPLDFIREACDDVDELSVGDEVEVRYRLSGRKWQKDSDSEVKFFLSAEATGFKVLGGSGGQASSSDRRAAKGNAQGGDPNALLAEAAGGQDDPPF